jgi:hypothetical protein
MARHALRRAIRKTLERLEIRGEVRVDLATARDLDQLRGPPLHGCLLFAGPLRNPYLGYRATHDQPFRGIFFVSHGSLVAPPRSLDSRLDGVAPMLLDPVCTCSIRHLGGVGQG